MSADATPTPRPTARLPLRRPLAGRRIAGVCAGLAAHLDVPVSRVRLAFIAFSLVAGTGIVLYLWFWATVPAGDPFEAAAASRPAAQGRLAPRIREHSSGLPVTDVGLGLLLLFAAGLLIAWRAGVDIAVAWLLPALVLLAGAGLAWSQLDAVERGHVTSRAGRTPVAVVRVLGGVLLAALGLLLLVGQGLPPGQLFRGAVALLAVLVGVALVLAPLWLRLVRQLDAERSARAREAERADIAAHLHDSVLQTLSLIRARAREPDVVARLARAQERELRDWLYADRPRAGDSLAEAIRVVAAQVEDLRGIPVEAVTVGDRRPSPGCDHLLAATREALLNAVVHGGPPVSLYAEIAEDRVEVFVRDRGPGFRLDDVPGDRFGVRESILGRMRRHGGEASVRGAGGRGTEVHLIAPLGMLEASHAAPVGGEPAAGGEVATVAMAPAIATADPSPDRRVDVREPDVTRE